MKSIVKEGYFYNPTKGNIDFSQVIREMISWMLKIPRAEYEIIVGCDSPSSQEPFFPVAIVILRKGQGGRFFLKKIGYDRPFNHWKERILQEVLLSCDLALSLKEALQNEFSKIQTPLTYEFKYIHADVGTEGATKDMIKEVIGIIQGNGFEAKIKPEAYVASNVADRYT